MTGEVSCDDNMLEGQEIWMPLTEQEKHMVCQVACDLETGNHLLGRPRPEGYRPFMSEVCIALDTPKEERNPRQEMLCEEYNKCFK